MSDDVGLLTFERVDVSYAGRVVVHDVSLTLTPGRVTGLVGASGCGKSTLLRAASGLLDDGAVTAGAIRYRGRDIAGLTREELRALRGPGIATVFQDCLAALTPVRRIGDQVLETLRAHGRASRREMRATFAETCARIGLDDVDRILRSRPYELSGGMGQRVGIAMALMLRPSVLLADEPTSALDVTAQARVVDELRRVRDEYGCAMLLATHAMGVVRALCDEVVVLRDGRVVEAGPTAEVLAHPADAYTRALIDAAPHIETGDVKGEGEG